MDKLNLTQDFDSVPVVPLRGIVMFPDMLLHFDVGRKKSVAALKEAMKNDQEVFLTAQRDASVDDPEFNDLYNLGTICKVKQMVKIPNSENLRVVVEGLERGVLVSLSQTKPFFAGAVDILEYIPQPDTNEEKAYSNLIRRAFDEYVAYIPKISNEVKAKVIAIKDSGKLCDFICSNTFLEYNEKQSVLDKISIRERLSTLLALLMKENASLEIESEIHEKVQKEIDKNQREYYIREEMKVLSDALGEDESPAEEADEYRAKINALKCSDEIKSKLLKECNKLMKMPSGSHEGTVVRNYLDKCIEIPFGKYTKNSVNLEKSRKILDKDHYSLDKVKDRIVESLAVFKRNPDFSGQIICLAGPPGVGKTSIVKSLARSMNRKYARIALGGIHDEAEIRGHRKTYIGAMTGRIIDAVIKSGVMNPIILLDEIDKIGKDIKGDPESALLEALDPEQNFSFEDHYIDFPVDLSKVMFITTANDTTAISAPLFDRMEVIELGSYTIEEKFHIAKEHLLPKEMKKHNLNKREFKLTDDAIYSIIESYTSEAGVRKLEKNIETLCRKAIVSIESNNEAFNVDDKNIEAILGPRRFEQDRINDNDLVGTVNGLAWTRVGGTLLPIEVSVLDGIGKIELTGNLGDVMKESAKTAVSYVRSIANELGIDSDFYKNKDIHIHAPESAIPKDGPSAGLAITTALVSELTGIPIKSEVAMTGEISLKGKALAIGGLKEKSMAAYKAGCKTVIIPKANVKDLADISNDVKSVVTFVPVTSFEQIMPIALLNVPKVGAHKSKNIIKNTPQTNEENTSITQ